MKRIGEDIIVFPNEGQMVVRITDPVIATKVRSLPYVQLMPGENQLLAALPWCEDSCKLFTNIGLDVTAAAPFNHIDCPLIEGQYTPMQHQQFTAAFITLNPRCYVLNDPRTGKTGSIILAMNYMQRHRLLTGGVLIITTVTTIHGVWLEGIRKTLPNAKIAVAHGPKREDALHDPADFYITNFDSCRISVDAFRTAVAEGRIGAVVIDEMTHVGNAGTKRHKAIDSIVNKMGIPVVVGATGSPGDDPEKVYGMCRMVNRGKLPCTTKTAWMGLVTYQYGPEKFMRKLTHNAPDIIHNAMQPAVRFNKADVIDLPPVVVQDRMCPMSTEQERMRQQFRAEALALTQSGEVITAANGGVLYQKLMQVAQGFCMDNKGKPIILDHKARTQTLLEAIGETKRKVVVFGVYRAVIAMMKEEIEKEGYSVGVIDGSTSALERSRILSRFQNEPDPTVIICHPTTTAYGTEMAAADTMIYNGPPPLGQFIYAQSLERLSSAKQTADKISIIRIMSSPDERKFFTTLDNGKEMGNFINTLFEDYARGIL